MKMRLTFQESLEGWKLRCTSYLLNLGSSANSCVSLLQSSLEGCALRDRLGVFAIINKQSLPTKVGSYHRT